MFGKLRRYLRRRKYAVGAHLTEWLAPDIRRDVEVVEASEVDHGYVTVRIRTWNVLYVVHGHATIPELEPPRRVAIADLWKWTGELWGGKIPDDDIGRAT